MPLTPVRLGATLGIFCAVVGDSATKAVNAMVYFEHMKKKLAHDITLNRVKVDDTRTLSPDEKMLAVTAMHEWIRE